jgi:hypothetical protein
MFKTSILVLDHQRPEESRRCLESLKKHAKFDNRVTFMSNGGDSSYAFEFFKEGLVDRLISERENLGCGFGTMELFNGARSKHAFYVQSDQFLQGDIFSSDVDKFVEILGTSEKVKHIDLAGNQGNGIFSERALFINVEFYNSIQKDGGGPGPFSHLKWTEESCQDFYKAHGFKFLSTNTLFANNGKISVRENPDGSKWRHRTDTKELWMLSPPTKKYGYPKFSNEEWEKVLEEKIWPDGQIPENEKPHSFNCFGE